MNPGAKRFMRVTTMLLLLAAGASPALFAAGPALMPMPVKVQATPGRFPINANFVVETVGGANARLAPAVRSFLARVSRQTGVLYAPAAAGAGGRPAPGDRVRRRAGVPRSGRRRIVHAGCLRAGGPHQGRDCGRRDPRRWRPSPN